MQLASFSYKMCAAYMYKIRGLKYNRKEPLQLSEPSCWSNGLFSAADFGKKKRSLPLLASRDMRRFGMTKNNLTCDLPVCGSGPLYSI